MPNLSSAHGEPAPGGGVGVGALGPPDDDEGMHVDSVTAVTGADNGAWSGVGGLGSGQVGVREAGAWVGLSEVHGASARQGAHLAESWDMEMSTVTASQPCPDQRADDDMPVHDADVHAADSGVPTAGQPLRKPRDEDEIRRRRQSKDARRNRGRRHAPP